MLQKLQDAVDFVWENSHCDLYRNRWAEHNIVSKPIINTFTDFEQLPLITKDDLLAYPTPDDRLFISRTDVAALSSTTGSTKGQPFFSWRNSFGNAYFKHLVSAGAKRAILVWSYHGACATTLTQITNAGIQTINVDPHQMGEVEQLLQSIDIDTLIISPSLAALLLQHISDSKLTEKIRFISLWGEECSSATFTFLQKQYPNALFFNQFSSSESHGVYLYKTPACDGPLSLVHVCTEDTYVEVCGDSALALTTVDLPHATPLVRYKTGDRGAWHKTRCACGSTEPRIQLQGRVDVDFVRTQGMDFRIEHIDTVLEAHEKQLRPIIHAFVSEVESENILKTKLEIQLVIRAESQVPEDILALQVLESLYSMPVSANMTIKKAIDAGLLEKPIISFSKDTLPTNKNKTIKRIID